MHALAIGFGLGFAVALQLGPMSLYLVRSTLAAGLGVGLAIGFGIALVDALYAAAGAAGAASLLAVGPLKTAFGLLGAAVLVVLGVRTLRSSVRETDGATAATPRRAFVTSFGATAANPLTIASWAAVFAAAGAAGAGEAPVLVAGVGLGSLAWVTLLAAGTALARRAVGPAAMRVADLVAGTALLGFGAVLALSVV